MPDQIRYVGRHKACQPPAASMDEHVMLTSIARLHIRREHDPQSCPRCERYFSDEALYDHLRQEVPCQLTDGRAKTDQQKLDDARDSWRPLMSRTSDGIHDWDRLWKFLFPQDEVVPPPSKAASSPSKASYLTCSQLWYHTSRSTRWTYPLWPTSSRPR